MHQFISSHINIILPILAAITAFLVYLNLRPKPKPPVVQEYLEIMDGIKYCPTTTELFQYADRVASFYEKWLASTPYDTLHQLNASLYAAMREKNLKLREKAMDSEGGHKKIYN